MANDREILREVWEGKLPVCFKLNSDEINQLQEPDAFYLMVPRLSYFPLVTEKVIKTAKQLGEWKREFQVRKHFLRYISNEQQDQEMWLEYDGQPIRWHLPIGVLFDLCMNAEVQLPWNIIVHFGKFPETQIFRFNNK